MAIHYKTEAEIEIMRTGGRILSKVLEETCKLAKPGLSTYELDKFAENLILELGGKPGFKGFHGYPATLCCGLNDVVVHGIPRKDEILSEGDVLTIDCGVIYKEFNTDAARTIPIGKVDEKISDMIRIGEKTLTMAINMALPGTFTGEISKLIEREINRSGYKIIRDLTGHGIGRDLHEDPIILNYYDGNKGVKLKPGMTIAIEPIFSSGNGRIKTDKDGWTIRTADGSLAIQTENTIAISEKGNEILTMQ